MGFIEKRNGRYRARYRDPLGRQRSETFTRKADAERFIREMQVEIERGRWIDPAGADMALAVWAEESLSFGAAAVAHNAGDVRPGSEAVRAAEVRRVPAGTATGGRSERLEQLTLARTPMKLRPSPTSTEPYEPFPPDERPLVALNVAVALLSALVVLPPLLVWADKRHWVAHGMVPEEVLDRDLEPARA